MNARSALVSPLAPEEDAFVRSLVIYQDDMILALNKPSGLSSQGGRGQGRTLDDLLAAFAKSNGKRPELVHRLDRDTSGVILAARTKPAASAKLQRPCVGSSRAGRPICGSAPRIIPTPKPPSRAIGPSDGASWGSALWSSAPKPVECISCVSIWLISAAPYWAIRATAAPSLQRDCRPDG